MSFNDTVWLWIVPPRNWNVMDFVEDLISETSELYHQGIETSHSMRTSLKDMTLNCTTKELKRSSRCSSNSLFVPLNCTTKELKLNLHSIDRNFNLALNCTTKELKPSAGPSNRYRCNLWIVPPRNWNYCTIFCPVEGTILWIVPPRNWNGTQDIRNKLLEPSELYHQGIETLWLC